MSSQTSSGTASDYGSGNPGGSFVGGSAAWTSIANMDGSSGFATCTLSSGLSTNVAEVTGLGFSVPSGATIDGIVVTFTGKDSSNSHHNFTYLQLLKGGSPTGTAKTVSMTNSSSNYTEGTSTDLWGGSFTYSDINGSGFGVGIQEQLDGGNNTVSLQALSIAVYYTGGGGGAK